MGMAAVVPDGLNLCLTQRLVLLRADQNFVNPYYLAHMLNHAEVQAIIAKFGRSAPPHLRVQDIPKICIPICPTDRQLELLPRLDASFTSAQEIERLVIEQRADVASLMRILRRRIYQLQDLGG